MALSLLSSGKHSAGGAGAYLTPSTSPIIVHSNKEKEHQQAMFAAMASQTILKKLGNAFWDAFVGSSSSSTFASPSASSTTRGSWDADKVKKVLEGKAVLRVIDVDNLPLTTTTTVGAGVSSSATSGGSRCSVAVDILEESMRSLTLGKV